MRVLHIVGNLSKGSGVMSCIMNYYKHIDNEMIKFDFIYMDDTPLSYIDELEKMGSRVYKIDLINRGVVGIYRELEKVFKQCHSLYKVIHNHELNINIFITALARKYDIHNLIIHSHATRYSDNKLKALRNRILCIGLKKQSNIYFACSEAAGKFLFGNRAFNKNQVRVLNNAIDVERYKFNLKVREEVRQELDLENNIVIGNIGRFNEQKNHRFLIEVFKELTKKEENVKLVLVGGGPLYKEILQQVELLGLEKKVLFLGVRNDVDRILQAVDIILMPSLYEGLPIIGIEAQCSGCKCYFSNTITKEVNLTNSSFISLDKNPQEWAELIVIQQEKDRSKKYEEIIKLNFNITKEAKLLEDYYLTLHK